eukprot:TRINITY_DN7527_c0_g1_i23.p1 TRINITY_DN7527_c0_g1~~TRINITY_DN7527_c0_g1_i23.p1  ORF type:complete len:170 (-),score=52.23 TRINITY_DN7527_c0_g1_i23:175-684(-)
MDLNVVIPPEPVQPEPTGMFSKFFSSSEPSNEEIQQLFSLPLSPSLLSLETSNNSNEQIERGHSVETTSKFTTSPGRPTIEERIKERREHLGLNNEVGGPAKVTSTRGEIEETKNTMRQNIERINERGERINELQEKTQQLEVDSARFASKVRELRRREEQKAFGLFDF